MTIPGYTVFWEGDWDYSKLSDDDLRAAIADCAEVMSKILSVAHPFPVDVAEQGAVSQALDLEWARRGLSEASES